MDNPAHRHRHRPCGLERDGLPDILHAGAGVPTHPNLGGGCFGPPQPLSRAPSALRLSSANVAFANMSGNGNVDLLVLDQPFAGILSAFRARWLGPPSFRPAGDLQPGAARIACRSARSHARSQRRRHNRHSRRYGAGLADIFAGRHRNVVRFSARSAAGSHAAGVSHRSARLPG